MPDESQEALAVRINSLLFQEKKIREIAERLLPHVQGKADHGYPFRSQYELQLVTAERSLETQLRLSEIETQLERLPEDHALALSYVLHRDMMNLLEMYREIANRKFQVTLLSDEELLAEAEKLSR